MKCFIRLWSVCACSILTTFSTHEALGTTFNAGGPRLRRGGKQLRCASSASCKALRQCHAQMQCSAIGMETCETPGTPPQLSWRQHGCSKLPGGASSCGTCKACSSNQACTVLLLVPMTQKASPSNSNLPPVAQRSDITPMAIAHTRVKCNTPRNSY